MQPDVQGGDAGGLDVRGVLRFLRRRWPLIVAVACLGGGAAYLRASSQDPVYEATSTVLFQSNSVQQALSGGSIPLSFFSDVPGATMQTNLRLIRQRPVAVEVKRRFGGAEDADALLGRIRTEQDGLSSLVKVTARGPAPEYVERLANTWSETFQRYQTRTERAQLQTAIRRVRAQLRTTEGLSRSRRELLARRLEDLETLNAAQTGTVTVVESAKAPGAPVAPQERSSTIVGLFLGLLAGFGVAFVRDALDRRFHGVKDIEERLGVPVVGAIPPPRGTTGFAAPTHRTAEAFVTLRTNVRFLSVKSRPQVFLVTSPGVSEGKTTTAMYLARSLAESGMNVLLIDGDLRHPDVARRSGLDPGDGVSTLIAENLTLEQGEQTLELREGDSEIGVHLHVLSSGPIPPNPIDFLGSDQMRRLLDDARTLNDYVIIDSPPVNSVADAATLSDLVDATLLIVRLDRTTIDQAESAMRALRIAGHVPNGVVVTGVSSRARGYGYQGYYYGAQQRSRLGRLRQSA